MGLCDGKSKSEPGVGQKPEINEFDQEIINQKFNEYISRDDIKDFVEKNYNLKDPVFQLIRENEIKKVENVLSIQKRRISYKYDFIFEWTKFTFYSNVNKINNLK